MAPFNHGNHDEDDREQARSNPVFNYFWQLLGSVSSAAVVGLFFWLWNVTLDIRDLQNTRAELQRVFSETAGSRAIIDRNSDRLTRIEAAIDQMRAADQGLYKAFDELRADGGRAHDNAAARAADYARLEEAVRQIERLLQSHSADERPNYRPAPRPGASPQ